MKESNFVSAVIYVRNAQEYIGTALTAVANLFRDRFKKWEIICVNDVSSDDSVGIIRKFVSTVPESQSVTLVTTSYYQGLERSMTAGVDLAIGDFVFEFDDANFDFDPELVMQVYDRCLEGYDIVSATSGTTGISKTFYNLFNKNSHIMSPLQSESFRIISRRAINRVNQMSAVVPYRKALYYNCGLKTDTIKYKPVRRNDSRYEPDERHFRFNLAIDSFILFTDIAYKISLALSLLMLLVSLSSGIYTLVIFLIGNPVLGWTTTMLLLAVGFFGMFAILTFVLKYLSVLISLTFEKRKYVIGSIEKL